MIQKPLTTQQISNEAEYQTALREISPYFDGPEIDPESAQGQCFLALLTLVEEYEKKHYPISQEDRDWLDLPGPDPDRSR